MNKQEVIDKIKNIGTLKINDTVLHQQIDMVVKNQVLDIISQIDESQKVVVPQFVAEYIEYCKHEKFYALHGAYDNMDDRLKCWRFKGNNSELFAKAWLYGYEVEKEQMYTVEIPNPNAPGHIVLHKDEHNQVYIDWHYKDDWKLLKSLKLTESEIKQDFEWAWQFAEEVKE
ncbi:hypothetical protein Si105_00144 [Streptococcus infantarius subsp. infantarius]|nr:hypothetical protein [Streptococcus infantarius subsp. infantarius]